MYILYTPPKTNIDNGKKTMNEDVSPNKIGDFPACHIMFQVGIPYLEKKNRVNRLGQESQANLYGSEKSPCQTFANLCSLPVGVFNPSKKGGLEKGTPLKSGDFEYNFWRYTPEN